jgi:hypothetical protein
MMEDYDDALGKLTKKTYLGSRRAEEDAGLFSPVYVLQGQQLTAEIFSISKAWRLSKWT